MHGTRGAGEHAIIVALVPHALAISRKTMLWVLKLVVKVRYHLAGPRLMHSGQLCVHQPLAVAPETAVSPLRFEAAGG